VLTVQQAKQRPPHTPVKVAGLVIRPHRPPTRSGRTVVFFTLEDESGLLDVTVFEDIYQQYGKEIFTAAVLLAAGHLDPRATPSLIARSLYPIS